MTDRTHAVKTLSLSPDIPRKGMERAAQFRMKFSHYISYLIERDYEEASTKIVIVAQPPPSRSELDKPGTS
jgi:hypothetical protein